MALRRAHGLAVGAVAALALLLLARLPPGVRPVVGRPAPAPAPVPVPRPEEPVAAAAHGAGERNASSARPPPQPPPQQHQPQHQPQPAAGPLLTGQLYVAGHARPHPELCPALGARLRLLVLVASAPSHSAARDAIRLTWGHYAARADVSVAFVLGVPPPGMRAAVDAEDALYGDLIVGNTVDAYTNLTLKTLSMLEWTDTYCPRAPRLLKTDDDMFINVPRLLEFASAPARANASRTIWGRVLHKALPKRTNKSKYYLSLAQFPRRVLPDFATGPAYLLTADAVRPLLAASAAEPYLPLEDVFVTGVLADRLAVRRTHAPQFYNKKMSPHPCTVQRGVALHMVRYHEQFDLWRKLLDGRTKCS